MAASGTAAVSGPAPSLAGLSAPVEPPFRPGDLRPTPPSTPAPPPRRRRGFAVGVSIAVAAIAVVAVLVAAGLIPGWGRPGGLASQLTFSQADAAAASASGSVSGGTWSTIGALGVESASATSVVVNATNLSGPFAGCVGTVLHGVNSLSLPASAGTFGRGLSGAWVVLLHNASGAVLVVLVAHGAVTPVYLARGGGLCQVIGSEVAALPSGVLDSPAAVQAVITAGGSAFLSAHPEANLTMEILGGIAVFGLSSDPTWELMLDDCPAYAFNGTAATSPALNASVDAITGSVRYVHTSTVSCRGSGSARTPIGTALDLGTPTVASDGANHWYNTTVAEARLGITLGDLTFQFRTTSGRLVVPPGGYSLEADGPSGAVVGVYSPTTSSWSSGGGYILVSGVQLVVAVASPLDGDAMVVTGTGAFSSSIAVLIP